MSTQHEFRDQGEVARIDSLTNEVRTLLRIVDEQKGIFAGPLRDLTNVLRLRLNDLDTYRDVRDEQTGNRA